MSHEHFARNCSAPLERAPHLSWSSAGKPRAPAKAHEPAPGAQEGAHMQRRLLVFFGVYALLLVALYATYAAYYFYQHQHQQQAAAHHSEPPARLQTDEPAHLEQLESRLQAKLHLLERYVELVAAELQETKSRLKEREKCHCSISCTFNGTSYADKSTWQNQCDICTCQSGRISCQPKKCPALSCDNPVSRPELCCPVCMRSCNYNNTIIKHDHKFKPVDSRSKECQCKDGRIKCEPVSRANSSAESRPEKRHAVALQQLAALKPRDNG